MHIGKKMKGHEFISLKDRTIKQYGRAIRVSSFSASTKNEEKEMRNAED